MKDDRREVSDMVVCPSCRWYVYGFGFCAVCGRAVCIYCMGRKDVLAGDFLSCVRHVAEVDKMNRRGR